MTANGKQIIFFFFPLVERLTDTLLWKTDLRPQTIDTWFCLLKRSCIERPEKKRDCIQGKHLIRIRYLGIPFVIHDLRVSQFSLDLRIYIFNFVICMRKEETSFSHSCRKLIWQCGKQDSFSFSMLKGEMVDFFSALKLFDRCVSITFFFKAQGIQLPSIFISLCITIKIYLRTCKIMLGERIVQYASLLVRHTFVTGSKYEGNHAKKKVAK